MAPDTPGYYGVKGDGVPYGQLAAEKHLGTDKASPLSLARSPLTASRHPNHAKTSHPYATDRQSVVTFQLIPQPLAIHRLSVEGPLLMVGTDEKNVLFN